MVLAILSKTWWRSFVKGDAPAPAERSDDLVAESESSSQTAESQELEAADFLFDDPEFSAEVEDAEPEPLLAEEGEEPRPRRKGRRERRASDEDERTEQRIPPRPKVASAKDFFSEEAIYRFDLLEPHRREELKGDYRVEVKGNKGGVWSVKVDNGLEIVNRREEAPVVLSVQQRDFIQLVNGDLNPQMAILAQKLRVNGDMRSVAAFQSLLVPPGSE